MDGDHTGSCARASPSPVDEVARVMLALGSSPWRPALIREYLLCNLIVLGAVWQKLICVDRDCPSYGLLFHTGAVKPQYL